MRRISLIMTIVAVLTATWLVSVSSQRPRTSTQTVTRTPTDPQLAVLSFVGGGQPRSVPGSINRGNGAVVKPGYIFVRRGAEVDVVRVDGRFKTGTYVCSCRSGNVNQKCELQFSPKQIFCRQGSCSGSACRLVPVEPAATQ